jgi:hypothetical protein
MRITDPSYLEQNSLREHYLSIPFYIIITLLTCGIANLYWNYRQMLACNDLLGREEFSWPMWFFLSLLTCGIYHLFYQYKMGSAILEVQQERGVAIMNELPLLSVLVSVFGASLVVDIIHQHEINKLCA